MRPFSIIVAIDSKQGIGKSGGLVWHVPGDLRHFKDVTSRVKDPAKKNAVIMGRKTWDSLPAKFRPLPGRLNVVLSRSPISLTDALVISDFQQALDLLGSDGYRHIESVFVIGGAQIYEAALHHPLCQNLYVTHVKGDFHCDAFFPDFESLYQISAQMPLEQYGDIIYYFADYTRKP